MQNTAAARPLWRCQARLALKPSGVKIIQCEWVALNPFEIDSSVGWDLRGKGNKSTEGNTALEKSMGNGENDMGY